MSKDVKTKTGSIITQSLANTVKSSAFDFVFESVSQAERKSVVSKQFENKALNHLTSKTLEKLSQTNKSLLDKKSTQSYSQRKSAIQSLIYDKNVINEEID